MPELVCAADDPRWQEERRKGVTATGITKGKSAEVDAGLWEAWKALKAAHDQSAEVLRLAEEQIREQIGDAQYLTVAGVKVATRVIRKVENASWTDDHFRRVKG